MSSINLPSPLSSSISCGVCGQSISTCNCSKASLTKAYYTTNTGNIGGISGSSYQVGGIYGNLNTVCGGCGQSLYLCQCNNSVVYKPLQLFTCNVCGQNLNLCVCQPSSIFITPTVQPTITTPFITTTTGTWIQTENFLLNFEVVDAETKDVFPHTGAFTLKQKSEKEGIYGYINTLSLPKTLKECFACLRKEDAKVWQIRSPLVFQLNVLVPEGEPEYHFMTLTSIDSADFLEDSVSLSNPHLQEVTNTLEFIRLIELQRVFTKLLRRI